MQKLEFGSLLNPNLQKVEMCTYIVQGYSVVGKIFSNNEDT